MYGQLPWTRLLEERTLGTVSNCIRYQWSISTEGEKNSQADMITVIHNLLADACINFNIRSHKLKQENCKASHKTKVDIESFISTILQKNNSMNIIYLHWLAVISSIAAVMQTLFNYWNNLALQFVGIPYLKWIFQKIRFKRSSFNTCSCYNFRHSHKISRFWYHKVIVGF